MVMLRARLAIILIGISVVSCTSNGGSTSTAVTALAAPAILDVQKGDGQTGVVARALRDDVVVQVRMSDGRLAIGNRVNFAVEVEGSFFPAAAQTDINGLAYSKWTLGGRTGLQRASVTSGGVASSIAAVAIADTSIKAP